jgi:hypothetical protein
VLLEQLPGVVLFVGDGQFRDVDVDHPVRAEASEAERPPTCLHGTERFGVQEVVTGTARAAPLEDPGYLGDVVPHFLGKHVGEHGCEHHEVERLVIDGKSVLGGLEPPGGVVLLVEDVGQREGVVRVLGGDVLAAPLDP